MIKDVSQADRAPGSLQSLPVYDYAPALPQQQRWEGVLSILILQTEKQKTLPKALQSANAEARTHIEIPLVLIRVLGHCNNSANPETMLNELRKPVAFFRPVEFK